MVEIALIIAMMSSGDGSDAMMATLFMMKGWYQCINTSMVMAIIQSLVIIVILVDTNS